MTLQTLPLDLEIFDLRLLDILDQAAGLEKVAAGFDFLEGPVWHPRYQSVIFSDILGNSIYSWRAESGVIKRNNHSYMANGNAYDHQGRLLTCEHATSRVSRTNLGNGEYEILATHYDGRQLNSPNDIVVKQDGTIYFTDPTSGRSAGYGVPREPELPYAGVYRLDPESRDLTLLIDDFSKPNGLCFSIDERHLYINDTNRQHIRQFDLTADGGLANGRLFANLIGKRPGVADGMKIDQDGHVYSCGPGGIHLFATDGTPLGIILMPEKTANFVFGDADLQTLYITASTSLYRLRTLRPGWPTYRPV